MRRGPFRRLAVTVTIGVVTALAVLAAAHVAHAQSGIVKREAWGARPAVTGRMQAHTIKGIIIHHTSARQKKGASLASKLRNLQHFSLNPGRVGKRAKPAWGDVPYHFYIGVSGRTAEGRSLKYAGDTNTGYKTDGWIQIVLEGDFTKEQPAPAQLAALRRLTSELKARYRITGNRISGHNDHASTNCPGPNLKRHIPSLR